MYIREEKQRSDLAMFFYCTDAIVAKVQNIFDCNFYKLIPETPALESLLC